MTPRERFDRLPALLDAYARSCATLGATLGVDRLAAKTVVNVRRKRLNDELQAIKKGLTE